MAWMKLAAALALLLSVGAQAAPSGERLYGRVTTAGGDVLEGYLRWDRNEASWADFLDGAKEVPWEHVLAAEELDPDRRGARRQERSIEAFGVRISWDRDDDRPVVVGSAVRFGVLEELTVLDARRARLRLKGGEEVVLRSSSSDLGRAMRGLIVEDERRGTVDLGWTDLDRVHFFAPPSGAPAPAADRLHGTLVTRAGVELTGFVSWDLDEAFGSDVLDGRSEPDGRDHEIAFSEIAAIEFESARSARVVLRDGSEVVLGGTNDVDRDNRGIEISDPALGRAIVRWEEFDVLTFHAPEAAYGGYDAFQAPRPLRGTVETVAGASYVGTIRWDNDEQSGWEVLDGESQGVDYDVELGRIASVRKLGSSSVEVTLLDGRVLELRGSNDVNRDNDGIFVAPDGGGTVLVRWTDFAEATFEW